MWSHSSVGKTLLDSRAFGTPTRAQTSTMWKCVIYFHPFRCIPHSANRLYVGSTKSLFWHFFFDFLFYLIAIRGALFQREGTINCGQKMTHCSNRPGLGQEIFQTKRVDCFPWLAFDRTERRLWNPVIEYILQSTEWPTEFYHGTTLQSNPVGSYSFQLIPQAM